MKAINMGIILLAGIGIGCTSTEAGYNASKYIINKECKNSSNCSGGIQNSYEQNARSQEEYQRSLSPEESERLIKTKEDLEKKERIQKSDKK